MSHTPLEIPPWNPEKLTKKPVPPPPAPTKHNSFNIMPKETHAKNVGMNNAQNEPNSQNRYGRRTQYDHNSPNRQRSRYRSKAPPPKSDQPQEEAPPILPHQIVSGKLTPQHRHYIYLMTHKVTPETTDSEIMNIKEAGTYLLTRPPFNYSIKAPVVSYMKVPSSIVDFFIEAFVIDQPYNMRFLCNKTFPNEITLSAALPIPIPISFVSKEQGKTHLGFYDSETSSAKETQDLVSVALNTIFNRNYLVYEFHNIDREYFNPTTLRQIQEKCDIIMLYKEIPPEEDMHEEQEQDEGIFSVKLYIMKVNFTEEKEKLVKNEIKALFEKVSLHECKICHNFFGIDDGSQCITHKHRGERIPFKNGEMEEYDADENGNFVQYVNYTCCGEIEINEDGCDPTPIYHENHIKNEETEFSVLKEIETKLFQ
ncbi:hypothetical protein GPJ56_000364 [Histomonas meleagridis]|uniref:uncharacterized protein n=1 Tax=Histomonas meleagridis TaxID=135588 RepID=UPI00355A7AD1|nr:hypothetical protein GPJ56_000364 [Histomonas meleagridis]KAH0796597.1 hypothetical protein GO595_010490 [Histomonas meleagridis]